MVSRFAIAILMVTFIALAVSLGRAEESSTASVRFRSEIQPLLSDKCGRCHRHDVRKGELDLSSLDGLWQGGESGDPAIGDSLEESPLWLLIEEGEMPPAGEPTLSASEIATIKAWIETLIRDQASGDTDQQTVNQHDVLPIVLLRCVTCHGPQRQDGGLDLRSKQAMLRGGDSGPAVVPGDAANSLMIQRIESEACPPGNLLLKFFVRRPSKSETDTLRRWINDGTPESEIAADVATDQPDPLVTEKDRRHWAFQPLNLARVHQDNMQLDDFVSRQLQQVGLTFAPEADRDTLIRRAYLDLIGMPPGLADWRRWREDQNPNWYRSMIDHLLASPHYGERWGRYWLDLAGYADSEGGISADPIRPVAWKYRDYVINAFNDDKPYDQFLIEQLAGDELIDYEHSEITAKVVDNLIATGFLRMGIDETGSRTMNFVPERLKVISDAISVVSSGLMGLTMECARCHSHKYDPIPQRDYYRFKAIFQGAFDEHDWHSFKTRKLKVAAAEHRDLVAKVNPPIQKEIKKLQAQQKTLTRQLQLQILRHHYPEQSESDNEKTIKALRIADNNRTLTQRTLVERLQHAEVQPDELQPESVQQTRREIEQLSRKIDHTTRTLVPPLEIRALWDQGRPSPTYILQRGEHTKPGRLVGPGVPSVLTDGRSTFDVSPPFPGGTVKTGRRLALARWLTKDDHPLTARVMVNRIWYHHFGKGIVTDLDNFGVKGARPSHPQLLDWLAVKFVNSRWSVKRMHRIIMNSRTYRQSSQVTESQQQADPQNRLYSRMPMRRMNAEALRDTLLLVADRLDPTPGGLPDTVSVDREGLVSVNATAAGRWRRSVYLQYRRTEIPTMMDTFDYPPMGPNCLSRNVSVVSPQALMLMNNQRIRALCESIASRVRRISDGSPESEVEMAFAILLSRAPSGSERQIALTSLCQLKTLSADQPDRALTAFCHTLINSAAFLYVD